MFSVASACWLAWLPRVLSMARPPAAAAGFDARSNPDDARRRDEGRHGHRTAI